MRLCVVQGLNRESERIPYGRRSLQLAAGNLQSSGSRKKPFASAA